MENTDTGSTTHPPISSVSVTLQENLLVAMTSLLDVRRTTPATLTVDIVGNRLRVVNSRTGECTENAHAKDVVIITTPLREEAAMTVAVLTRGREPSGHELQVDGQIVTLFYGRVRKCRPPHTTLTHRWLIVIGEIGQSSILSVDAVRWVRPL